MCLYLDFILTVYYSIILTIVLNHSAGVKDLKSNWSKIAERSVIEMRPKIKFKC